MAARKHVSLKTKLAAVLRDMAVERNGRLERALTYEEAKAMTDDQVLSLFQWDHGIHHAIGGTDEHWNLTARFIDDHRRKTAKIDIPRLAKTDRITDKEAEFQRRLSAKTEDLSGQETGQKERHKFRWGKRPWPSKPFPKKQVV